MRTAAYLAPLETGPGASVVEGDGRPDCHGNLRPLLYAFGLVEPVRKGIAVTRSFGAPVLTCKGMDEAVVSYAARAAEKLRRHKIATCHLSVFLHTSAHNNDPWYSNDCQAESTTRCSEAERAVDVAVAVNLDEAEAGVLLMVWAKAAIERTAVLDLCAKGERDRQGLLYFVKAVYISASP